MTVEQGGQADHQVLADFVDPDGDDLLLVGATADPAAGSVRFRQDGTLTFKADGSTLGRTRVTVAGLRRHHRRPRASLDVDVRPARLAGAADRPGLRRHLRRHSPSRCTRWTRCAARPSEPPRLAGVDDVVGATVTSDLQARHVHVQRRPRGHLLRAVPRRRVAAAGHRARARSTSRSGPRPRRPRSRSGTGRRCPPAARSPSTRSTTTPTRRARCSSCSRSTSPRGRACGSPCSTTTSCRSAPSAR